MTRRNGRTPPTNRRSASPAAPDDRLAVIEQIITGQRRDFDSLANVMYLRDVQIKALQDTATPLPGCIEDVRDLKERLAYYETNIPLVRSARLALEKKRKRDAVKAAREEAQRAAAAAAPAEPIVSTKPGRWRRS